MNAVWDKHEVSDPLRVCLLLCQVARRLLVLGRTAEGGDATARLEVKGCARPDEVVVGRSVAKTQVLTLFQHPERRCVVSDL